MENTNKSFVFIYAKEQVIKVLNFEKSEMTHDILIEQGWIHTNTLDVCAYIQYLHNDCGKSELFDKIKSLHVNKNK